MTKYKSIVNIQWAISTEAPSYELANENIKEIVNSLLSDNRFQEISNESIDIDITEV